jgi:hypothetical protein
MMHVELSVAPVWSRVPNVRDSLTHAARAVGLVEDGAYAVGMVVSELLENAIKYGTYAEGVAIQVVVHLAAGVARVVVTNPVDPSSAHPHRLRAAVARLGEVTSPLEAYVSRVTEILEEPAHSQVKPSAGALAHEDSGLGIFRVAHEAESTVSLRFLAEGSVEVSASMQWSRDGERVLVA